MFSQNDATVKNYDEGEAVALIESAPIQTLSKTPFKCVIPEEIVYDDYHIPWTTLDVDYQLDENSILECQSYTFEL